MWIFFYFVMKGILLKLTVPNYSSQPLIVPRLLQWKYGLIRENYCKALILSSLRHGWPQPGDLSRFLLSCLGLLVFLLLKIFFYYLAVQCFDFEHTWWSLFQKFVCTKLNIYVFANIKGCINKYCIHKLS